MATDKRPPVLYLRAFRADRRASRFFEWTPFTHRTVEEQMMFAVQGIGPLVAVGDPSEKITTLGAAREYFQSDDWQTRVKKLMRKVSPGPSEGGFV